jgi:hypothetical protein
LTIAVYLEVQPWAKQHRTFEAWFVGITVGMEYWPGHILYFLFGFKYWVISLEMPKYIDAQEKEFEEDATTSVLLGQ